MLSETAANDIFISYAREDLSFTRQLRDAMQAAHRKVWVDVDDAFAGEKFWSQICDAIESAKAFVFVISPASAASKYCRQEIEHAVSCGKRIVPVVCSVFEGLTLPDAVASRQWVIFDANDFDSAFATFIAAIDADLPWLAEHTRLLTEATAWDRQHRDSSYLLRGNRLSQSEQVLAASTGKDPPPTSLQTQFLLASRRQATKRQRNALGLVTLALCVSFVLGGIAFYQYRQSEARGQIARGRLLASQAANRMDSQLDLAILLSLEAFRFHPSKETEGTILAGLQHNPRLLTYLRGHEGAVLALEFSADGQWLASGGADGTIVMWDLHARAPRGPPLRGHSGAVLALSLAADSQSLTSVDSAGEIIAWDLASGRQLKRLRSEHPESINVAAFSRDGRTLALAGRYSLTLWDAATGRRLGQPIYGPLALVFSLAFSPDGKRLLTGDQRTGLIEWDVATQQPVGDPIKSGARVARVAYGPDGTRIASATRWVTFWDARKRRPLGEPRRGHESDVTRVRFSPDGALLASSSADSTVRLWDVERQALVAVLQTGQASGTVRTVAFSPDGKLLASAGDNGVIHLWRISPSPLVRQVLEGRVDLLHSVAFSPDGQTIAAGGHEGGIQLWDRTTGQPRQSPLQGHDHSQVVTLAFSPDGHRLVSGSTGWTSTIRLWDVATAQPLGEPQAAHQVANRPFGVFVTAFDARGERLASGGWDGRLRLWDGRTVTQQTYSLDGQQGSVMSLAFSPDGSRVASGGGSGDIVLWDTTSGASIARRKYGDRRAVLGLIFTADGRELISVHADGTLVVSDSNALTEHKRVTPREGGDVLGVAFSSDRKRAATLNGDGAIWIWNLHALERLDTPLRPVSAVVSVVTATWAGLAFSPDGKLLASAAPGNNVLLWDVDLASWQDQACARVSRNLSSAEWDEFLGPGTPYRKTCPKVVPVAGHS